MSSLINQENIKSGPANQKKKKLQTGMGMKFFNGWTTWFFFFKYNILPSSTFSCHTCFNTYSTCRLQRSPDSSTFCNCLQYEISNSRATVDSHGRPGLVDRISASFVDGFRCMVMCENHQREPNSIKCQKNIRRWSLQNLCEAMAQALQPSFTHFIAGLGILEYWVAVWGFAWCMLLRDCMLEVVKVCGGLRY